MQAAIFTAVLAELDAKGWADFRMDAVADRARVSKASLYRRWPGKLELVTAAVGTLRPDPVTLPDTGSLRGDLLVAFRLVAEQLTGPAGAAFRGMLTDALSDKTAAADFRLRSRGRSVALVDHIVERADARGELDAASVTRLQRETGLAMVRHQFLVEGAVSDDYLVALVDQVLVPLLRHPR